MKSNFQDALLIKDWLLSDFAGRAVHWGILGIFTHYVIPAHN